MSTKEFEQIIHFRNIQDSNGNSFHFPIVEVTLITPTNDRRVLPLLFDTGASVTSLRSDLFPLLGLQRWDEGLRIQTGTVGGLVDVYQYTGTLEIFGKNITCPINLIQMNAHPLFQGLLGRDTVFKEFGFGFWESTNKLYVTPNP